MLRVDSQYRYRLTTTAESILGNTERLAALGLSSTQAAITSAGGCYDEGPEPFGAHVVHDGEHILLSYYRIIVSVCHDGYLPMTVGYPSLHNYVRRLVRLPTHVRVSGDLPGRIVTGKNPKSTRGTVEAMRTAMLTAHNLPAHFPAAVLEAFGNPASDGW